MSARRRPFLRKVRAGFTLALTGLSLSPAALAGEERRNHEGRLLPSMPGIPSPVLFNTPQADRILSAMQIMPRDSAWNEDIRQRPVLPGSAAMIQHIGPGGRLRVNLDMGFVIVPPAQARVPVTLGAFAAESDPGPFPIPENMPIEMWPLDGTKLADTQARGKGDRHGIVVDPFNGMLYEFAEVYKTAAGWTASASAKFSLRNNVLRPLSWTSSDAAGLPIFPAIIRYDEVQRGMVEHAMRVTFEKTRRAYIYPATHFASKRTDADLPAMGQRFRLKSTANLAGLSPHALAVAKGLQKYGMIVADNGGNWSLSVAPDARIKNLDDLSRFRGSDFEVIETTGPQDPPRLPLR